MTSSQMASSIRDNRNPSPPHRRKTARHVHLRHKFEAVQKEKEQSSGHYALESRGTIRIIHAVNTRCTIHSIQTTRALLAVSRHQLDALDVVAAVAGLDAEDEPVQQGVDPARQASGAKDAHGQDREEPHVRDCYRVSVNLGTRCHVTRSEKRKRHLR